MAYNGFSELRRKIGQSEARKRQAGAGKSVFSHMDRQPDSVDTVMADWLDTELEDTKKILNADDAKLGGNANAHRRGQQSISLEHEMSEQDNRDKVQADERYKMMSTPECVDTMISGQRMMNTDDAERAFDEPHFANCMLDRSRKLIQDQSCKHTSWIHRFEETHHKQLGLLEKKLLVQDRSRFTSSVAQYTALSRHLGGVSSGLMDGGADKAISIVRLDAQQSNLSKKIRLHQRFAWFIALSTLQHGCELRLSYREQQFVQHLKEIADGQEEPITEKQLKAAISTQLEPGGMLSATSDSLKPMVFAILTHLGMPEESQNRWILKLLNPQGIRTERLAQQIKDRRMSTSIRTGHAFVTQSGGSHGEESPSDPLQDLPLTPGTSPSLKGSVTSQSPRNSS
eukprot:TRINITY_DN21216_c0_g1_i4.p1 TRINITY_DN21216_c0_g1~~TRINITY_DN21216_c0_g1_i4.p1  ORF type:complete len:399 (+),score=90.17 TRINITY_DN21216_c0_g1_i4:391-1587(+)